MPKLLVLPMRSANARQLWTKTSHVEMVTDTWGTSAWRAYTRAGVEKAQLVRDMYPDCRATHVL